MNEKISEILDGFKISDGIYKREHIDSAIELKDEISPYLVKILESVLSDPEKYIENKKLIDHVYSIMLLGHFRESKAHNVIVDLFSLPDDMSYKLYGDLLSGDLPTILVRTCDRHIDLIKSVYPKTFAQCTGLIDDVSINSGMFPASFTGRPNYRHRMGIID